MPRLSAKKLRTSWALEERRDGPSMLWTIKYNRLSGKRWSFDSLLRYDLLETFLSSLNVCCSRFFLDKVPFTKSTTPSLSKEDECLPKVLPPRAVLSLPSIPLPKTLGYGPFTIFEISLACSIFVLPFKGRFTIFCDGAQNFTNG